MIQVLLVALAIGPAALAQSFDDLALVPPPYPYDIDFDNHLLHMHPEVNYAPHPDWLAAWERDRLGHGGLLGTFGSTAVDELLIDARWTLNPDLGSGMRLRNDILWQQWRHRPHERRQVWLGLEQRLWRELGVVIQTVPAEDKEWIDVRLGGVWTSRDRRQYAQLLYRRDDIVHDSKSARGGTTVQRPEGVDWLLRFERDDWSLYSRGHWLREADRVYDDASRAPVIAGHGYAGNEALVRLRWRPATRTHLELAWRLVEDAQTRTYHGEQTTAYDHEFSGRYRTLGFRGLLPLDRRWRLRGELHHVARRVAVTGWRPLRHARDEWLPAIFAERRWNERSWLELGYLGTFYGYTDTDRGDDRDHGAKIELGAVVGLKAGSALKASLSHQVIRGRFGGFNLRLIAWF